MRRLSDLRYKTIINVLPSPNPQAQFIVIKIENEAMGTPIKTINPTIFLQFDSKSIC